jgi:hypothetical protein
MKEIGREKEKRGEGENSRKRSERKQKELMIRSGHSITFMRPEYVKQAKDEENEET